MTSDQPLYDDDQPVGYVLSRKAMLRLLGGAGASVLLAACAPASSTTARTGASATTGATAADATATGCVARPALTEGPYFVDERLNRSDIRSDPADGSVKPGTPLRLTFLVSRAGSACAPLAGATVDVWHCDALGVYSDVADPSFNTVGKRYLRGYQVTDASGAARFTTIYPGWYQGRTVHIHFKIRLAAASGGTYDFTSQLFFDDALSDQMYAQAPYNAKGQRTVRNNGDSIYAGGGQQLTLAVTQDAQGYAATFAIGLQL
jgi:protocatechuate 3,4-dioxygenase beta subunit